MHAHHLQPHSATSNTPYAKMQLAGQIAGYVFSASVNVALTATKQYVIERVIEPGVDRVVPVIQPVVTFCGSEFKIRKRHKKLVVRALAGMMAAQPGVGGLEKVILSESINEQVPAVLLRAVGDVDKNQLADGVDAALKLVVTNDQVREVGVEVGRNVAIIGSTIRTGLVATPYAYNFTEVICGICFERPKNRRIRCGHCYCVECIADLQENELDCAFCDRPIADVQPIFL